MRRPTFARSRRTQFGSSPGSPFWGYTGNPFMQQTNFTGHAQGGIQLINPTGPTAIGSALQLELLGLHDGDILYIEMAASFSNSSGTNRTISLSLDPNGDNAILIASLHFPIGPDGLLHIAAAVSEKGQTTSNLFECFAWSQLDGYGFNNVQPTIDVNLTGVTVTLLYAMATRIRAGF